MFIETSKPDNIFLDSAGNVKIGDFGLGHTLLHQTKIKFDCGTPVFFSPEVISGDDVDPKKSDVWCVGLVFYLILFRKLPWRVTTIDEIFEDILYADLVFPHSISKNIEDLIRRLLDKDPNQRPTAAEANNILSQISESRNNSSLLKSSEVLNRHRSSDYFKVNSILKFDSMRCISLNQRNNPMKLYRNTSIVPAKRRNSSFL